MTTNITDSDAWTTPIVVPDDAEPATQASILLYVQPIANRTAHMRKGIPGIAASIDVEVPLNGPIEVAGFDTTALLDAWAQTAVAGSEELRYQLALPRFGGTITQVHALVDGRAGGGAAHAGLPGTMPRLELQYRDVTVGNTDPSSLTAVSGADDASASTTAYEKIHQIDLTGLSETISTARKYSIVVSGESGANAQANDFTLLKLWVTITP